LSFPGIGKIFWVAKKTECSTKGIRNLLRICRILQLSIDLRNLVPVSLEFLPVTVLLQPQFSARVALRMPILTTLLPPAKLDKWFHLAADRAALRSGGVGSRSDHGGNLFESAARWRHVSIITAAPAIASPELCPPPVAAVETN
jgi:hypothetical protein